VLHGQVVLLSVVTKEIPRVSAEERLEVISLKQGFFQVTVNNGFMQSPNVPAALRGCESCGLKVNPNSTTYYLARETLIPSLKHPGMMPWREKLFPFMRLVTPFPRLISAGYRLRGLLSWAYRSNYSLTWYTLRSFLLKELLQNLSPHLRTAGLVEFLRIFLIRQGPLNIVDVGILNIADYI
jgi:hypothetical protein